MYERLGRLVVCAMLVIVAGTAITAARTIRVPQDIAKIQKAVHAASEGDTVFVAPGIYNERVVLEDGICLIGADKRQTIIWGRENRPVITGADHTLIKNVTIRGGRVGVLCENKLMTIEQNIISENAETGIHCLISLPTIRNNLVLRNKNSGIFCESVRGIKTSIENNVCAENGYSGITLTGLTEILIQNNVLFSNGQFGIYVNEASRRTRIVYNCFYGNRRQYNQFAVVNTTNSAIYPGYIPLVPSSYEYFNLSRRPLAGLGKEGVDIGIMDEEVFVQQQVDADRDGVVGQQDQCPSEAEDHDGFEDEDGCPDFDNDKDGFFDKDDACPDEAEDVDGFMDMDGCPDLDNDKDGIPDISDKCPMQPETVNGYQDDDGCPDEKP